MRKFIMPFLLLLLCFPVASLAHPGGTDEKGGHNSPNGYHYHHGYPAHHHYHNICPYDVAEIAYDTAYPWEYQSFLDEYVDGFDCGYDIGAWNGEDDGYSDYHNGTDSFNPWTEYEDDDYPQESPYAYGYCDGYRFGYCIRFEERYNDEAYYDGDYEEYYDPEIEEVRHYARYKTTDTSNSNHQSTETKNDNSDISNSIGELTDSKDDNSLLHKIKVFFVEPANSVGDSKAILLLLSIVCLSAILIFVGGLVSLVGAIASSDKVEKIGKKIATVGLYGFSAPIWIMLFIFMAVLAVPFSITDFFSKRKSK